MPNVSPKEVFAPWQQKDLLIAHIASPGSIRNLRTNPKACVSFIDVFVQKGYKVKGEASIVEKKDRRYEALKKPLLEIAGGQFPIQAIIYIRTETTEPIIAPSYRLFPKQSEQFRIERAMRTYGVMPRNLKLQTLAYEDHDPASSHQQTDD